MSTVERKGIILCVHLHVYINYLINVTFYKHKNSNGSRACAVKKSLLLSRDETTNFVDDPASKLVGVKKDSPL